MFFREWNKELEQKKTKGSSPSLLLAVLRAFGPRYMLYGIPAFFEVCSSFFFQFQLHKPSQQFILFDYIFGGKTVKCFLNNNVGISVHAALLILSQ